MAETVCPPRSRHKYPAGCERLVDMEFEEKFSKKFIAEVRESEKAYSKGDYVKVKTARERQRLFDSI